MQEVENVLDILEKTKKAVEREDVALLKDLSNRTIHSASVEQDSDNIAIAVIVYSLGKIIERKKTNEYTEWESFYKKYLMAINNSINALKKGDEIKLKKNLENLRKEIDRLSKNFRKYIQDVFRKASINKASKIYEHGISMQKTAELLGITVWELATYAGQKSNLSEDKTNKKNVKQRIKLAMDFFGK